MSPGNDTIFALSSGGLPSGIAVIRLSGEAAFGILESLAGMLPPPRKIVLRTIRTRNGLKLDHGLVVIFPAPNSFTGEDCVEIHVHGGKAVVAALLDELATVPGCRQAEAGEFSKRALDNGKMDLLEIEGLADLIAAETEMQRRLAVEQSSGGLSELYDGWAARLTRARALVEAELDFADEGDVPGSVSDRIWRDMQYLLDEMQRHFDAGASAEIIRDGYRVVIAGPPNVGKSSLMNALAQRDLAIVTDMAGTTRDVLQLDLDIEGYAVKLFDTAGLRDAVEHIEREGIRRAVMAMENADLILLLMEVGNDFQGENVFADHADIIRVGTKSDLGHHDGQGSYDLVISTQNGDGLSELRALLAKRLKTRFAGLSMALPSRRRHRDLLWKATASLREAVRADGEGLDIRAESLRLAAHSLGRITGRVDVEDLLGVIFSEFCIGK